jgi:hypothetical protein
MKNVSFDFYILERFDNTMNELKISINELSEKIKAREMLLGERTVQVRMMARIISILIPGATYEKIDERLDYYFEKANLDEEEIAFCIVQDLRT